MFRDNNLLLFLFCILPIIIYSLLMFFNSPTLSIRLKTTFTYFYIGLLSITILQAIHFIFPHIGDLFFKSDNQQINANGFPFQVSQPTFNTLVFYTFIQIGLMEELSKWISIKAVDYMRGKRRKNLDHPYAIMFYCSIVGASFAVLENIQYVKRAMIGEFGPIQPFDMLVTRGISSVIIHMCCGLFIGYYLALSKGFGRFKRILYNLIGIAAASFAHGLYDLAWLSPDSQNKYYNLFSTIPVHISSTLVIFFSLVMALLMSWHLKFIEKDKISKLK